MQETIENIRREIIRILKDHGEIPLKILIDNIWRDDRLDIEFEESPEKIVEEAVIMLEKEGLVIRIGDLDNTIQLNPEMLYEDYKIEEESITSPWRLKVFGQIYIPNLNLLEREILLEKFNELKEKKLIDKNFYDVETVENNFEINWKFQGFYSKLVVFPSGDFVIIVNFNGEFHPELIKNPELSSEESKRLIQSVLGTGFFELYVVLKKIVTKLFEYASIRITDYRFIRTKE
ncbi:MAG: hypothetical protein ACTSRR_01390 [Candidatus Heimdallarchaeaceae archaeon]